MNKSLSERTQQLLNELEIDQVQLSNLAGVTKGAVNQWLHSTKPSATMSPIPAYSIADKTAYEPRWLMTGEGPDKKQVEKKQIELLQTLFEATDDRGKDMILHVAEGQLKVSRSSLAEVKKST